MDYSDAIVIVGRFPKLKKGIEAFLEDKKKKGLELPEEKVGKFYALMLHNIPSHAWGRVKGEGDLFRFFANGMFFRLLEKS